MKNHIRFLIAGAMLFGSSTVMAQSTKVAIGFSSAADFLPVMVAKETGIFEKHGIDAELTKVAIISNIPAAIMSGSLQIGAATPPMLLDTSRSGLDLPAISAATRFLADPAIFSVVARDGTDIKTAKDLEGKRIGVPGLRSVADVVFRQWLLEKGADVTKLSIVEAPFPQMKDMLKSGTIDAVPVLEPFRARIVADNTGYRVADYMAEVSPDILGAIWVGQRAWLDAHPKVVEGFRQSLAEGIKYIHDNPEKAREIEKQYLGFASTFPIPYSTKLDKADFDAYAQMFKSAGYVNQVPDTSNLIYP